MAAPYTSFVQQIADAQEPQSGANPGAVPDCVPWYGHGHLPADPAWGSAFTFLADLVAEQYDDNAIFSRHYDSIKAHLQYLVTTATSDNDDGLLAFSWWGDWCPPSGCAPSRTHTNSALVSSFEYILQLRMVARYAGILGHSADASYFGSLAANASSAFVSHFYDASAHTFSEPGRTCSEELTTQTCISLASTLGLIPEADIDNVYATLAHDVEVVNNNHLNVGIVGIKELLPALARAGRIDLAVAVLVQPTQPSYVYMVQQGATTLWETWTGSRYQPVARCVRTLAWGPMFEADADVT